MVLHFIELATDGRITMPFISLMGTDPMLKFGHNSANPMAGTLYSYYNFITFSLVIEYNVLRVQGIMKLD